MLFRLSSSLFLSAGLLTFSAQAQLKIPTLTTYESGRFLCEKKYKDLIAYEKGFYMEVPLNYAEPINSDTTSVYAYFSGEFDPQLPTLIYFTGGPGQTAHWSPFQSKLKFNVLVMEQRGIGCSKPINFQQSLSPEFYSSEAVAHDAYFILQKLGIAKATAYGISYGTVPATIFASLFPESTQALVLEGTVYSGDESLWSSPHKRKLVQKMLDTLPENIKSRLNQVTGDEGVPPTWFSILARNKLMYNEGLKDFREELMNLADDKRFAGFRKMVKEFFEPMVAEPHPLFVQNDIPYYMISCQEFGLGKTSTSTAEALEKGSTLIPVPDREAQSRCRELGVKSRKIYEAVKYPVKVPVTYFQGSDDSATPAPGAIKHFKSVPTGFAQLLILKKGGHNPNKQLLESEPGQIEMFETALRGEEITPQIIRQFNEKSELDWAVAYRQSGATRLKYSSHAE